MGYQVLARKYRPQRFADVAGQDHVTRTLLNALTQNRIAHGYIFSGHRGIGKTTIARILAMALNCRSQVGSPERPTHEPCLQCVSCREISSGGNPEGGELTTHSFDFIEIDAASNRGIDDVRSIRTQASVQPARDKYKIFLLDEAHQITEAAFNAILKTLEEPPEWTIFMMATTEPENIPQTIRSRCQHFSFHAVKFDDILSQLQMIAEREQVVAEQSALALLAEAGDGSMRDALSIMDQAIASAPTRDGRPVLAADQIRELMGSVPNAVFERLLEAVAAGQSAELMEQLNLLLNAGHSPQSLARQMVRYLRNALMAKLGGEETELLQISADERARATRTALLFSEEDLTRNLQIVLRTFDDLNYRQEQRFHLELGLLKLIHMQRLLPLEELLSGVAGGIGVRPAPAAPTPRSTPPAPPRSFSTAPPAAATNPTLSPFASSSRSNSIADMPAIKQSAAGVETVADTVVEMPAPASRSKREVMPFPAAAVPAAGFAEVLTEGALAMAPEPTNGYLVPAGGAEPPNSEATELPDESQLREVVCSALASAGHVSASQLLGSGAWTLDNATLRIEVAGMGKKMLSLTVNAAAEKIIRQELQRLGASSRFLVVPGAANGAGPAPTLAPIAGSVHEEALKNPLVQRAKEIFNAEVRSVVDLRGQ
jgi:DNA polymerase III subunit gamma/tau